MKSLKWLGVGTVFVVGTLAACANGSAVTEDEQEVTKPSDDAATAADTYRPSTRDSSTTPTDADTPTDAAKADADAATIPDSSTPDTSTPPPDASTGVANCDTSNPLLVVLAGVQITNLDFPSCNSGCSTCCWPNPVRFCLKP